MALIVVQSDGAWLPVRRKCRFSVERGLADAPAHLKTAVRAAMTEAVRCLEAQGFEYAGSVPPELRGPFEHLTYSDDRSADDGPEAEPQLGAFLTAESYVAASERFEAREKARIAPTLEPRDLVDYELVLTFKQPRLRRYHVVAPQG